MLIPPKRQRLTILLLSASLLATSCAPAAQRANLVAPETEGESVPIPELSAAEQARLAQFAVPKLSLSAELHILQKYSAIDPNHEIPDNLLSAALTYYDANLAKIPNKAYLTIVDFKPDSKNSRLFVITMSTGSVWKMHVAHGSGSDPKDTGLATRFSNVPNSRMSSLGFFLTARIYVGKHGRSLRIDGLSASNSNVRKRAIVVHSANYVYDTDVKPGRSSGCFAVSEANKDTLIQEIDGGSLMYAAQSS